MLSFSQSIKDPSDLQKLKLCHGVILKRWDLAPEHPPLAQSHFASGLEEFTPSSQTRNPIRNSGWDLRPGRPTPAPI
jgi:hypothetical protein